MSTTLFKQALVITTLCLVIFAEISLAKHSGSSAERQEEEEQYASSCNLKNLNPLEPIRRIEHEGGVTEFWDENNEQLRCAGVSAIRHIIQPRSLLLPSFNNAPMIVLVIQGDGILQTMMPGCAETYQSFQQQPKEEIKEQRQSYGGDQHQKLHNLRRGDAVALPEGIAHWVYNDGNQDLVLVVIHHTNNRNNQLDQNLRRFFLAGNPQQQQQQQQQRGEQSKQEQQRQQGNNVFQALDIDTLAEAFGVNQETARKLQNRDDKRGNIIRVHKGFQMLRPSSSSEQQQQQKEEIFNGIEETYCTQRISENLIDPERSDIYTARGGSISTLNSYNLPILKYIKLSAGQGILRPNAMVAPYWNLNAHSISYIARGSARVQIVGTSNNAAYDGEVKQGQLLIIPQNFIHVKQAGNEGLEWFTVKTNDRAKSSLLAGKTSVIRAMPVDVIMNAYQVSREEAMSLKFNRQEVTILSPLQSQRQTTSPWSVLQYMI